MTEETLEYYVGMFGEKLPYYGSIDVDIDQPDHSDLRKLLKENKVKMKKLNKNSEFGYPMVNLTGARKDLLKVLSDLIDFYGNSTSQWMPVD